MDEVSWAIVVVLGLLGLLIGSFLNVVIARVPEGRSIVSPGSACPNCGADLHWRDNVPLLSWVLLRGRCRSCSTPISIRYPIIEALNALLWICLSWWALGPGDQASLLPLLLILASAGLALAAIDLERHRLPDPIVLALYPVTVVGLLLSQLISGDGHWLDALIGAAIWSAVIGGLWLFTAGQGMGFGDVKLAPILGTVLGWLGIAQAVIGLLAAFLVGAVVGVALLLTGRAKRGTHLAFGPFLLGGVFIGILVGMSIWDAYSRATGL